MSAAETETGFQSTGELLLYPLVEDGRAEAPDFADLQGANVPAPRHLLESLGMELQDRCRLVRVEQWLWEKCTWQ
jgi:hypothetical protein